MKILKGFSGLLKALGIEKEVNADVEKTMKKEKLDEPIHEIMDRFKRVVEEYPKKD